MAHNNGVQEDSCGVLSSTLCNLRTWNYPLSMILEARRWFNLIDPKIFSYYIYKEHKFHIPHEVKGALLQPEIHTKENVAELYMQFL